VTLPKLSLLAKIWLSTSVALTALFGITGLILQQHTVATTRASIQAEIQDSFHAYESLWKSRSETLGSVAAVLSSLPNVRAAFQTRHAPTIRDTARELWLKVADQLKETAFFVVAEPDGHTIALLDDSSPTAIPAQWPMIKAVREMFPKQASGFYVINEDLFQLVLTPVYIDASQGSALSKILVTGYVVNHLVAQRLKESTGKSEFLFVSGDKVFASTLNDRATRVLQAKVTAPSMLDLVDDGVAEYALLRTELIDMEKRPVGLLCVFRSFEGARQRIRSLQASLVVIWLFAVAAGLGVSFFLARRMIRPIRRLDEAAAEVARQNYSIRVPSSTQDEMGRLAKTFNAMCDSLQAARQELIRQERISTIGRMASSIVHDLRNPLAAIYGGAEMMVDTDLSPPQVKRVAANIYRSSRRIQEMLQDLLQLTRGAKGQKETCSLAEVIEGGLEPLRASAAENCVSLHVQVPPNLELPLERARVERVFMNLAGNALEALGTGGEIRIQAKDTGDAVEIEVSDNGPGIHPDVRSQLFQPFATYGKKNGLGLGLALSRQTVLDHGGDIWVADRVGPGATFCIRLPKQSRSVEPAAAVHLN